LKNNPVSFFYIHEPGRLSGKKALPTGRAFLFVEVVKIMMEFPPPDNFV